MGNHVALLSAQWSVLPTPFGAQSESLTNGPVAHVGSDGEEKHTRGLPSIITRKTALPCEPFTVKPNHLIPRFRRDFMIRVQIEVQQQHGGWCIKFCTVYLHDTVLTPIVMTERLFASQYSAVTDMRRLVLAFLTKESYLDETAPIDWQILSWFPPVSRPVHELS
jgi:hypothetical protein